MTPTAGELYKLKFEVNGSEAELDDLLMYIRKTKFEDYVFYCIPKETMLLLSYREISYVIERVKK